ncbi:MAG TPA: dienelactone hydrolase family protein [Xanthobacteraceae bacterium]|nr:dienelactone hydrolase family protein [Xanthobacteraceae bacterium]
MHVEHVTYELAGKKYVGALVYDDKITRPRPALLMCPNWMGMRQQAVERAALLAGDRYVVFAVDMYGEGIRPKDFGEAAALANPLREDPAEARRRARAAYDTFLRLAKQRGLINDQRAAVGFCFGGGNVLELARDGADLQAAVAIHSDLKTNAPAKPGDIKAALLVIHGTPDPVVPKADRDAFEAEMDAAGVKWQMLLFSGILHAFTDEDSNVAGVAIYDANASRQTYALTHGFIADAFAGQL